MASYKTKQILENSEETGCAVKLPQEKKKREAKRFNIKSQLATSRPYLLSSYPLQ